jgi:hypothetical protein
MPAADACSQLIGAATGVRFVGVVGLAAITTGGVTGFVGADATSGGVITFGGVAVIGFDIGVFGFANIIGAGVGATGRFVGAYVIGFAVTFATGGNDVIGFGSGFTNAIGFGATGEFVGAYVIGFAVTGVYAIGFGATGVTGAYVIGLALTTGDATGVVGFATELFAAGVVGWGVDTVVIATGLVVGWVVAVDAGGFSSSGF